MPKFSGVSDCFKEIANSDQLEDANSDKMSSGRSHDRNEKSRNKASGPPIADQDIDELMEQPTKKVSVHHDFGTTIGFQSRSSQTPASTKRKSSELATSESSKDGHDPARVRLTDSQRAAANFLQPPPVPSHATVISPKKRDLLSASSQPSSSISSSHSSAFRRPEQQSTGNKKPTGNLKRLSEEFQQDATEQGDPDEFEMDLAEAKRALKAFGHYGRKLEQWLDDKEAEMLRMMDVDVYGEFEEEEGVLVLSGTEKRLREERDQLRRELNIKAGEFSDVSTKHEKIQNDLTNSGKFIQSLQTQVQSVTGRAKELEEMLFAAEGSKDKMAKDLAELRNLVGMNDAGDAKKVITALKDINTAMDDFAFNLLEHITPDSATISSSTALEILSETTLKLSSLLNVAKYSDHHHPRVSDILVPLVKGVISEHLKRIFTCFHFLLIHQHARSKEYNETYKHVKQTQHVAARWRSTTYDSITCRYSNTSQDTFSRIVSDAAFDVDLLLSALNIKNPYKSKEVSIDEQAFIDIFYNAIELQKLIRRDYFTSDFVPFLFNSPLDGSRIAFDQRVMDDDSSTEPAAEGVLVVAGTSFGLQQSKVMEGGKIQATTLLKAGVMTTRLLDRKLKMDQV